MVTVLWGEVTVGSGAELDLWANGTVGANGLASAANRRVIEMTLEHRSELVPAG